MRSTDGVAQTKEQNNGPRLIVLEPALIKKRVVKVSQDTTL